MNFLNDTFIAADHARVKDFFANHVESLKHRLMQLDVEISQNTIPQLNDKFHHRVLEAIQDSQEACRRFEDENREDRTLVSGVQNAFRQETDPWFSRSWFANRARIKPSGFPGDFEMLRMLYKEAMPPTPARGLGGYLDLCLMHSPLANAVRSRMIHARDFLVREIESRSGETRILDIACGPCREYMDCPEFGRNSRLEVLAMDSDPLALEFVDKHVASHLPTGCLKTVRYNALRTRSASSNRRRFGSFDIIYSVGLCDYLPDEHLVGMLSAWRETLNDGGVLYVAFKDADQYDETLYQWHLDWFFYQRTQQDMLNLYQAAGFNIEAMKTTRDDTGIIINFINRVPRQTWNRTDTSDHGLNWHAGEETISTIAKAEFADD